MGEVVRKIRGILLIKSKLEEAKDDCVILYPLFDNSFYLAKTAEGGLIPVVREESG